MKETLSYFLLSHLQRRLQDKDSHGFRASVFLAIQTSSCFVFLPTFVCGRDHFALVIQNVLHNMMCQRKRLMKMRVLDK